MNDFLANLRTIAWRTAGARYNAARRLRRRELFSVSSLAFFSALSVAVAFVQRIYSPLPGTPLDNYLTASSMVLGVFLLAVSLMEWGAAHGATAEMLHRNAEDLTGFQLKLARVLAQHSSGSAPDEEVESLRLEYEAIKSRCGGNHSPLDDELFRAKQRLAPEFLTQNGTPKMGLLLSWWIIFQWGCWSVWYFVCAWIVVLLGLAYAFRLA